MSLIILIIISVVVTTVVHVFVKALENAAGFSRTPQEIFNEVCLTNRDDNFDYAASYNDRAFEGNY
jgi:hypothetical protein